LSIDIQRLRSGDIARMRELLCVFGDAFDEPVRYTDNQPSDEYLRRLMSSDSFLAVAALAGGQVVGGLTAYLLPKPEMESAEAYIYDLAVDESHRRRGIATALIRRLREEVAELGATVIFVQADAEDDEAIALYETIGQREKVFHFDIPVSRTEPP